ELGEQSQGITVDIASAAAKAQSSAKPAIAEHGTERVATLTQVVGYVEGLIMQLVVVARPAGVHDVVADGYAVQGCFIDAQCGDVKPRVAHACAHIKLAAEQGGRRIGFVLPTGRDE